MSSLFSNQKIVDQFLEECIKPMFPNSSIFGSSSGLIPGHLQNPPIRKLSFNQNNKYYVGSKYSFNGVHKFLHYTSLRGLLGILDSKQLRLYNLKCMDDPHEVSYVLDSLNLTPKSEYTASYKKDGFYCLSMVEPRVEKTENSLDLWRKYGEDGRGVAIELEFQKRQVPHWVQYHLSRVYYGEQELSYLKEWWERCHHFMRQNGLQLEELDAAFNIAKACHKRDIYRSEREVRLIFSLRDNLHISDYDIEKQKRKESSIHFDVSGNRKPTDYHILEVESDRWKKFKPMEGLSATKGDFKRLYPQVKVKSVIFGYRYSRNEAADLCRFIRENLNRNILCYVSPLRKHFSSDYNEVEFYGYRKRVPKLESAQNQ